MKRSCSLAEKKRLITRRAKVKPFHFLVLCYTTIILIGIPIRLLKIDALMVLLSILFLILATAGFTLFFRKRKVV